MIKAKNDKLWGLKHHRMYNNCWDCAVDIGSNEGQFSKTYCRVFKKVVGFDPNLDRLQKNLYLTRRFNNYTFYPVGMYDTNITKKFYKFHTHHGLSTLDKQYADENLRYWNHSADSVTEDYVHLQEFDFFKLQPNFIKIDVEGVANNVIIGALDTIFYFKPTIQVERGVSEKLLTYIGYIPVSRYSDNHEQFSDEIYVHKSRLPT